MQIPIHATGTLIRRYKRFLADVRLPDGTMETVHCPNSGSMRSLLNEGATVWLSYHPSPKRRLSYTLEVIELPGGDLACVNTMLPNRVVHEAILQKRIEGLKRFSTVTREVSYGDSRFDMCVQGKRDMYVEVKNVTLMEPDVPGVAQFPDAPTTRGQKHLKGLTTLGRDGYMFFCVNRTDCERFMVARHIDRTYHEAFLTAMNAGVRMMAYRSYIGIENNVLTIEVSHRIPILKGD